MSTLLIEDEADFVATVKRVFVAANEELVTSQDIQLIEAFDTESGDPIEEQLAQRLRDAVEARGIQLVLLDTDLSRNARFQTQTSYRQALFTEGIPACRYRKVSRLNAGQQLSLVRQLTTEGASAIRVDHDLVSAEGVEDKLVPWVQAITQGFTQLFDALSDGDDPLNHSLGPSGVLADILGRPSLRSDLLGYTAQNANFFGDTNANTSRRLFATRLGYWLFNYILAFPGPILHRGAAAAHLNLTLESFDRGDVQELIKPARYQGPFDRVSPLWWREELDKVFNDDGGFGGPGQVDTNALRFVDTSGQRRAFYCLINKRPIPANEAATSPDWIPVGAELTRIRKDDLDQLGPMLNI
jgi:hypothetical protein